jgi:hypothetical protein
MRLPRFSLSRLKQRLPRVPLSRRKLYVLVGLGVLTLGAGLSFGPLVRARIAAEGERRHVSVEVGGVRPGWFAVRLANVVVRPEGVEAQAHLDDVTVHLTVGLRPERVELHGGEVVLNGDADALRVQLRAWRGRGGTSAGTSTKYVVPITGEGLALRWIDGDSRPPSAELSGIGFSRDADGFRLATSGGAVRSGGGSLEIADASLELDPQGSLAGAHAASLILEWNPRENHRSAVPLPSTSGEEAAPTVSSPSPSPVLAARTQQSRGRPPVPGPAKAQDPSTPFVHLPDLHRLRGKASLLASLLSDHVPVGAGATVDAMTWKIGPDAERIAFTFGPGPLVFTRTPTRFELRFSTDPRAAATALAVRALLPTDGGDVSATLEGGPVSLALLGIREGAAGLVDVAHATVTGTAHVVLAGDGAGMTFDAQLGSRDLSVREPKLAPDVVRGVDLDLRLRGALDDAGAVRLDDFAGTLGALHIAGSGTFEQKPDHVGATLRFDLPSAPCQALLDSVPTALLPELQGTRMVGAFGAHGRFAFDTRALDDLQLEYDVQDDCRMKQVPQPLARDRFKQPFEHRVYLPDGSTAEQMTGPETDNWTPLTQISPYMQVAVMTTEDGAFLHHRGFNRAAIRASIIANLKARRFVRGASTITMQLAKNLFLSRDKTLARKLEEVVLADYLEQTFTKDELMELYLNVIEFGPAVYGITAAAEYYFGRSPSELSLAESLFLSSLLPAPLRYAGMRDAEQAPEGWTHTLRNLMQIAGKRGLLTDAEVAEGQAEPIVFWHGGQRPSARPPVRMRSRLQGEPDDTDSAPVLPPDPDGL